MGLTMNHDLHESPFPDLTQNRDQVFAGIACLPAIVQDQARSSYLRRVNTSNGKTPLGESAPVLVSSLIPDISSHEIEAAIHPWLGIYAFTLLIDDVIDDDTVDRSALVIAASLFLEKALSFAYSTASDPATLRTHIDSYFESAASAFSLEEILRRESKSFSASTLKILREKVSLIHLCLPLLLRNRSTGIPPNAQSAVDRLALAMQLLDDVTDWEDDHRNHTTTILLSEGFRWAQDRGVPADQLTADGVLTSVLMSGALHKSTRIAAFLLFHVRLAVPQKSFSTPGWQLLNDSYQSCTHLSKQVSALRRMRFQEIGCMADPADARATINAATSTTESVRQEIVRAANST